MPTFRIKIRRGAEVDMLLPATDRFDALRIVTELAMKYDEPDNPTLIVSIYEQKEQPIHHSPDGG